MFLLEAAFLTTMVLVGLSLYTFWAARRGYDFKFLAPFLFVASLVLLLYLIMQVKKKSLSVFVLHSICRFECDYPAYSLIIFIIFPFSSASH